MKRAHFQVNTVNDGGTVYFAHTRVLASISKIHFGKDPFCHKLVDSRLQITIAVILKKNTIILLTVLL